jgi:16S rRNA (guanine527-N7)-methyltransferase
MMVAGTRRPSDREARLRRRAKRAGIPLTPDLAGRLLTYLDLLFLWNRKINLTALEPDDEGIDRLVIEPLIAGRFLPSGAASLMDVGSGGGSPAIPMKLANPGLSLRMVESKVRKSAFLREAVRRLELQDVFVETARFEELLARPELHESAEVVTIRAVRVEGATLRALHAFLAPGGLLFWFRSGAEPPKVLPLPFTWLGSHLLIEALGSRLEIAQKAI